MASLEDRRYPKGYKSKHGTTSRNKHLSRKRKEKNWGEKTTRMKIPSKR